jgi:hypothetical protein
LQHPAVNSSPKAKTFRSNFVMAKVIELILPSGRM